MVSGHRADFFFDETLVLTIPLDKPNAEGQDAFKKPHYLLVNLALGSSSGPIEDDKMPQRMVVNTSASISKSSTSFQLVDVRG
ncbi:MAG: hypothetical protein QM755_18680 [Luteolibacter sp.]